MKLMTVIVQKEDTQELADALRENGHAFTLVGTTGGFLRQGNTTLFMAIQENEIESVLILIQENCKKRTQWMNGMPTGMEPGMYVSQPIEVVVGGAVVFVLDLEQFAKY